MLENWSSVFEGAPDFVSEQVAGGRLYMEPVEVGGGDIDASVRQLYKPPAAPST